MSLLFISIFPKSDAAGARDGAHLPICRRDCAGWPMPWPNPVPSAPVLPLRASAETPRATQ